MVNDMKAQNVLKLLFGMQLSFILIAYSDQENVPDPNPMQRRPDSFYEYSSTHLKFFYTSIDSNSIQAIARYVEANCERILIDLKPDSLSTISIYLYPVLKDVHQAIDWFDAPNWVGGSATGINEIRMISPNSIDLDASISYNFMLTCIVHEFVHCVSMHVNQTIVNKPRWLWEAVALYESAHFVDPKTLSYLKKGKPPSIGDLNNINDTRIYDVGYTIMAFIIGNWGIEAVRELIRSNGDLVNTLHMNDMEFLENWYNFIFKKYLYKI